jgi:hypothetical protein
MLRTDLTWYKKLASAFFWLCTTINMVQYCMLHLGAVATSTFADGQELHGWHTCPLFIFALRLV